MSAYADFAAIYDLLMDDFDYPAWAEYYLAQIAAMGVTPETMCDCACGTGSMTVEFARRGLKVTGIDISAQMLERAAEKARQSGVKVALAQQDMCALSLIRPVDVLVCACDGVNYLLTEKRLRAFFAHAHAALRPGGVLAFDISSPHKLLDVLGDGFFGEERDEAAYLWQNRREENIINMDITFFVRREDGLYRRFAEVHRQRAHKADELEALLAEAGFRDIRVFGDRTTAAPGLQEMRMHFFAVRA